VGLLALFLLARDVGGRHAGLIALLLGAVNPFDIHFSQQAQMYSQVVALITLSAWCLWRWIAASADPDRPGRWWAWALGYIACAVAMIYTQYLSALILLAQGLIMLSWSVWRLRLLNVVTYSFGALVVVVAFAPWVTFVREIRGSLYYTEWDWIPPPQFADFYSFLGGEFFWGQARNLHESWWMPTMVLPALVLVLCLWLLYRNRKRSAAEGGQAPALGIVYLLWLLVGPLLLAAVIVHLYYTIYWRPRFSVFLLPPFLALAGVACSAFRGRVASWASAALLALVMLGGTVLQSRAPLGMDWREVAAVWREEGPPARSVFFPPPLAVPIEHYLEEPLASTPRNEMEKRLAELEGQEIWVCSDIYRHWQDSDYYNWLMSLGEVRRIVPPHNLNLQAVRVASSPGAGGLKAQWYGPIDVAGTVIGFGDPERFYVLESDTETGMLSRWSRPKAWLALYGHDDAATIVVKASLPPPVVENYRPELQLFLKHGLDESGLFETAPVGGVETWQPGIIEVNLPVPPGIGTLWVGWTINPINLSKLGVAADPRDLGLRVEKIGVLSSPETR
jgi:hypothetical protein